MPQVFGGSGCVILKYLPKQLKSPIAQRHGPVRKLKDHEEELQSIVDAQPDLTLGEIAAKLSIKV